MQSFVLLNLHLGMLFVMWYIMIRSMAAEILPFLSRVLYRNEKKLKTDHQKNTWCSFAAWNTSSNACNSIIDACDMLSCTPIPITVPQHYSIENKFEMLKRRGKNNTELFFKLGDQGTAAYLWRIKEHSGLGPKFLFPHIRMAPYRRVELSGFHIHSSFIK